MLTRWRISFVLAAVYVQCRTSGGESLGTSVVSCATCQAVQVHLQHLTCDVNCDVVKSNKGTYLTTIDSFVFFSQTKLITLSKHQKIRVILK